MGTFAGKKYEVALGNLRLADESEQTTLQSILDLKSKVKKIQEEISRLSTSLPHDVAMSSKVLIDGEAKWSSFVLGRPKWLHVSVPETSLERHNTTISDKKELNINS